MKTTPLRELLAHADTLLGKQGGVRVPMNDPVGELAARLQEADAPVELSPGTSAEAPGSDIEKAAGCLNRLLLLADLETDSRLRELEKRAQAAGHAPEAIREALLQVAAGDAHRILPHLVAAGELSRTWGEIA